MKLKLKEALKDRGLSYNWLADQCNVTETTIRNWADNNKKPSYEKFLKICECMELKPEELTKE